MSSPFATIAPSDLDLVAGGADAPAASTALAAATPSRLTNVTNAAKGFVGGLECLAKFTVDGTPGTNTYDTYLACQRKAHQF